MVLSICLWRTLSYTQEAEKINVFIDCDFCDKESIKQNITYVNYAIDKRTANVHALFTKQANGSGGKNIIIQYYGQSEFANINDSISYSYEANTAQLTQNELLNQYFEQGLLTYILRTPLKEFVSFNYERPDISEQVKDKWDSWVFSINADGRYAKESSYQSITGSGSISIQRITDQLKFRSYTSYFKRIDRYNFGGDEIQSLTEDFYSSSLLVKSINDHWSYGGEVLFNSSYYENIKLRQSYWLAVEYNLFPYSQSARRQLRITPEFGYDYRTYNDTTIFNKIREGFFAFDLLVAFEMIEKWGKAGLNLEAVSFLYDLNKYQLSASTFLRLRLFRGFSLNISGNVDMIRNQISLLKEGLTDEDVLLQQKQLATNFRFNMRYGISYTFGSRNNNIVNTRFGW